MKQAATEAPSGGAVISKVYWPNPQMKRDLVQDARDFGKKESEFIVLCCLARRNPALLIELAGLFGTKLGTQATSDPASDARLKEMEAELRREQGLREAAEDRAAQLEARLQEVDAERRLLLQRYLVEADLHASPPGGLVAGEHRRLEVPPMEVVRALDVLTSGARGGGQQWVHEGPLVAHMKEKEGVPDAAMARVLIRRAKRMELVAEKQGRLALTPQGRAMAGGD